MGQSKIRKGEIAAEQESQEGGNLLAFSGLWKNFCKLNNTKVLNPTLKKGTVHNDARNDSCNCQLMQSEMAIVFYVMKYLNQKKAWHE